MGGFRDDCHLHVWFDGNRRDVFYVDLSTSRLAERERVLFGDQDIRGSPG